VHLVEYLSYTCPHCAHFAEESAAVLKGQMIRSGSVKLEVRNMIADKADLTAVTLARCVGPKAFPRYHELVFARQRDWVERAVQHDQANAAREALYPIEGRLRAIADASGLITIAREAGATPQAIEACFTGRAAIDRAADGAMKIRQDVRGTPAFEINGKLVQGAGWAQLEPMLRAAGAK
jgi:protein-disulfide isomerase